MIGKSHRKEIFDIFFGSNLKQGTNEVYFFKHAQIINNQYALCVRIIF